MPNRKTEGIIPIHNWLSSFNSNWDVRYKSQDICTSLVCYLPECKYNCIQFHSYFHS